MKVELVIISIFTILSCQNVSTPRAEANRNHLQSSVSMTDALEPDVYGAVIDSFLYDSGSLLISSQSTFGRVSPDDSKEKVISFLNRNLNPNLSKELIDSYRKANERPEALRSEITTKVPYTLFDKSQTGNDSSVSDGKFMDGTFVKFSKIGFTSDQKTALLYISYYSGTRSGAGYYVALAFEDNGWRVKQKLSAWLL